MTQGDEFSLDRLVGHFEQCAEHLEKTGEVDTIMYTAGLKELKKVFDNMGSGFAFAFKDLEDKVETLALHGPKFQSISKLLDNEVARGSKPPNDSILNEQGAVSPARAVNRSSHVCMWITGIFGELLKGESVDMPTAASNAYEPTLCQIHGFIVRNSVRLAFNMLPDRAMFLHTCRISEQDLKEKGKRFVNASNRITDQMRRYFADKGLEWIF